MAAHQGPAPYPMPLAAPHYVAGSPDAASARPDPSAYWAPAAAPAAASGSSSGFFGNAAQGWFVTCDADRCDDAEAICFEPEQVHESGSWQYVGKGRGGYDKVQMINYVGKGNGSYEHERMIRTEKKLRPVCWGLVALSCAGIVASVVCVIFPDVLPLSSPTTTTTPASSFGHRGHFCLSTEEMPEPRRLACCQEFGRLCRGATAASPLAGAPTGAAGAAAAPASLAPGAGANVAAAAAAEAAFAAVAPKVAAAVPPGKGEALAQGQLYDCSASSPQSVAGWSAAKRAWCCPHRGTGCMTLPRMAASPLPAGVGATKAAPLPNCEIGHESWQRTWSAAKKDWCCQHAGRGCSTASASAPTEKPYDCQAGYANWISGWSESKKAWCCDHKHKGCKAGVSPLAAAAAKALGVMPATAVAAGAPAPGMARSGQAVEHDCALGFANWQWSWSARKQAWCCQHESKGCGSAAAA